MEDSEIMVLNGCQDNGSMKVKTFKDREDAGNQLAKSLASYKEQNPLVLAIPRGGVEVGYQVAKALNAPFSIIIVRKLPFPDNPEAGFGAIAEDGSIYLVDEATTWLSKETIFDILKRQKKEINRRIKVLRQGKPLTSSIAGKTVILVDDGIAVGSTMQAAIMLCRNKKAKQIIVAVPVADEAVAEEFEKIVDDIVVLEKPPYFSAVAQVYRNWHDVTDEELLKLLKKSTV